MLFSCLTLSAQQEEKPQPVEGAIIVNFIEGAIRQAYPVVKKQAANWLYNQLFSVTTPISLGLTVGVGVAATGLTIFVMYKIYDKYLRKELTKEQTEQEISNAIYAMVSDDLTYPTYSAKIHVLLKKDEFLNYLDDTDEIFTESCNKTIAKVTDAKSKRDAAKDGAIDAKMNDITKQMVSMTSNAQKLKYVTDTYINDKNKFPMFVYTIIDVVEQWSLQFIGGSLSEKDMNALNQKIKSFKEYLLSNLTIEQRAAYSLYLRLKNKTAVEKLLSAEQKAIRNPWKV
jgi:hypothetical protein